MASKASSWAEREGRPGDLFELLDRPRFDPHRGEIRSAIRAAARELLAQQNSPDPRVAARAAELQAELGRADEVFGSDAKLRAYYAVLLDTIRDAYRARAAPPGLADLHRWLAAEQRVHALAIPEVAKALVSPGGVEVPIPPTSGAAAAVEQGLVDTQECAVAETARGRRPSVFQRPSGSPKVTMVLQESTQQSAPAIPVAGPPPLPAEERVSRAVETVRRPPVKSAHVGPSRATFQPKRRTLLLAGSALGISAVLIVDVLWMTRWLGRSRAPEEAVSAAGVDVPSEPESADPRRSSPEPGPTAQPAAPSPPPRTPQSPARGAQVRWTGTLERIHGQMGPPAEIHLLVRRSAPGENPGVFEAYATDERFPREILDYVAGTEREGNTGADDRVVVAGTVVAPDAARIRLVHSADMPLVRLTEVERVGEPESRARVGGPPRPENSFRTAPDTCALTGLLRMLPPAGTEVRLTGRFRFYDPESKTLFVSPGERGDRGVEVYFPSDAFSKYEPGQAVEVTGLFNGQVYNRSVGGSLIERPIIVARTVRRPGVDEALLARAPNGGPESPSVSGDFNSKYRGPALLVSSETGIAAVRVDGRWSLLDLKGRGLRKLNWGYVDRSGACWLAGEGGLVRLDGRDVTTYGPADGLPTQPLSHVYEDSRRRLWVSSWEGGVSLREEGHWRTFTRQDGLRDLDVNGCVEDVRGRIWAVGTKTTLFQNATFEGDELGSQIDLKVMSVDGDPRGRVFLGCIGGLIAFEDLTFRAITTNEGLPQRTPQATFVDSRGRIWAGTWGGGIVEIDADTLAVRTENVLPGRIHVRRIAEDADGALWAATLEGLWTLDADVWKYAPTPARLEQIAVVATIPEAIAAQLIAWADGKPASLRSAPPRRPGGAPAADSKRSPRRKLKELTVVSPTTGQPSGIHERSSKRLQVQKALGDPAVSQEFTVAGEKRAADVFVCPSGPNEVSLVLVGSNAAGVVDYLSRESGLPAGDTMVQNTAVVELVTDYIANIESDAAK